jgi:tetratricopeptide (TPR) repeat protein
LSNSSKTASLLGINQRFKETPLSLRRIPRLIGVLVAVLALSACTSMVTSKLGDNLSNAIANQNDPDTVRAGAPAFMLLIDGMISGNPKDQRLLIAGSRLFSAYAAVFVEDPERAKKMADHAFKYAERALCQRQTNICELRKGPYLELLPAIKATAYEDIDALYTYALSWALWIQTHSSDWGAVADLPKVEALLEQVISLNKKYEQGEPYLYLGIIRSQLPPALGGKPEKGREAFEQAIALSDGHNLMAKVEYARRYARLVFDRELHDRLLNEVLAANPEVPGLTLSNTLAQRQAKQLLQSAADYF